MPDTPTQEQIDQSWRELCDLLKTGDPYVSGGAAEEIPHTRRVQLIERTRAHYAMFPRR